ncbi:hypothetical protein FGG08_002672 [Glutinoglossum americanum]|uniref:Protein kinase domain-containing protein n=1 Tax=Glutinoglossum americanum TaxID=1670608 RepID=A0A9P8L4B2_9PEZI|nr:hypothetical protein FGG08_002672 [Glutinoglossum americanum]
MHGKPIVNGMLKSLHVEAMSTCFFIVDCGLEAHHVEVEPALSTIYVEWGARSSPAVRSDLPPLADDRPYSPKIRNSEYGRLVKEKGLLLPIEEERNWSGRIAGAGQHVEFKPTDSVPLEVLHRIGSSNTARIDKVRCRRILLARKSMKCCVRLRLDDAINEVEHLQKLRHAHIVQLVGSYTQGKTFAILLYPAADYDLSTFMERVTQALWNVGRVREDVLIRLEYKSEERRCYWNYLTILSFGSFFGCLSSALKFIHDRTTKHMDIKPANILVKEHERYENRHHVYIADFGISRSFSQLDHSQTDSMITKTPKYCAPEVYRGGKWGRSADIFSMGCVFLEMHTILCSKTLDDFEDYRCHGGIDGSFHANLQWVYEWADLLRGSKPYLTTIDQDTSFTAIERNDRVIAITLSMLEPDPEKRPRAQKLAALFGPSNCCDAGPESLAAEEVAKYGNNYDADPWRPLLVENDENLPHSYLQKRSKRQVCHYLLQKAASNGHEPIVKLLLERGADIEAKDKDGWTVLQRAVSNGHELVVNLLLERGADVEAKGKGRWTVLQRAASNGHELVVNLLLERGADVEAKSKSGWTALQWATSNGHEPIVKLLLEKGADIEVKDYSGRTALQLAVSGGHILITKLLLEKGADVAAKDIWGRTVLQHAASQGYAPILNLLLGKEGDIAGYS